MQIFFCRADCGHEPDLSLKTRKRKKSSRGGGIVAVTIKADVGANRWYFKGGPAPGLTPAASSLGLWVSKWVD